MKNKSTQILFHIVGCTIFLLLPIIFWLGEGGILEFFADDRALRGYIGNIIMLLFFYFLFYLLIPKLYFQKKYFYFILVVLFCYLIVALLPEIIVPFKYHGHPPGDPGHDGKTFTIGSRILFRLGHHLIFFLAVVFFSLLVKINNRLKKMEKEKLKTELAYFKAQINPHFLFNTLNSIYSLAIQKDDKTPEAVVKLSGMMRYVISDANHDFVPLEQEISYISDYIELQKIRLGKTATIDYQPCEPDAGKHIAPLLLIPFIENAFKFGINPEKESVITVRMSLDDSELHLAVFNFKVKETGESDKAGGLGISNARQRLSLLYPNKHRLVIFENDKEFKVDLYIDLQ